jgi:pimeloyl-ACP methyl ester carboxylesterase
MATEGGASAVRDDPAGFARLQWDNWGPTRWFDDATCDLVAGSFRNPDWAAITLHGYRSRWRPEALDPRYAKQRSIVEATEILHVPTLMIQGRADECDPPAESENQDRFFSKSYSRVVLDGVGHFPARESAEVVAEHLLAHLEPGRAASKRKQLNATPFATSLQP